MNAFERHAAVHKHLSSDKCSTCHAFVNQRRSRDCGSGLEVETHLTDLFCAVTHRLSWITCHVQPPAATWLLVSCMVWLLRHSRARVRLSQDHLQLLCFLSGARCPEILWAINLMDWPLLRGCKQSCPGPDVIIVHTSLSSKLCVKSSEDFVQKNLVVQLKNLCHCHQDPP